MKHIISLLLLLIIADTAHAQIKMLSNGKIGIGTTTPSQSLEIKRNLVFINFENEYGVKDIYFNAYIDEAQIYPSETNYGSFGTYTKRWDKGYFNTVYLNQYVYYSSDSRFKTNKKPLENSLDKVLKLNAFKYDIDLRLSKNYSELTANYLIKSQLGFLAQDVQNIIPEAVKYDSTSDEYAIMYDALIPVLVEAIKELNTQVEYLKNQVQLLESNNFKNTSDNDPETVICKLFQNSPNPFDESTKIDYFITEKANNAAIYIYDMNGSLVKNITIHSKGYSSITLSGSELKPGMYMYTLIVDGQSIDTKTMILTD